MLIQSMHQALDKLGDSFSFKPFSAILQPMIEEVLAEQGKDQVRRGTLLKPQLLVWLVLALTVRRDLNCRKVLNWLVSGFRWMLSLLPAKSTLVQEGAISHARVKLGVELFRALFARLSASAPLEADFYGWVTVIFDGTTGSTPDTESNARTFKKPKSGRGAGAFPQVRIMALLARSARLVLEVAYAACGGKGTGERALALQILERVSHLRSLLFLLDAGLYAFDVLWKIVEQGHTFIVKAPKTVKLKPIQVLPDGSYLAYLTKKVPDPEAPPTKSGRRRWKTVSLLVRVIRLEIPGYRPFTLLTNLVDVAIPAREIALYYHQRWDIEITYDEIKTHQCATLRGQSPTTFRSKRADLVEQELYALVIMYNLVRLLIHQAATQHGKDPRFISFLDALQHLIDAAPILTADPSGQDAEKLDYLLAVMADCDLDRPRRPRLNPRVVKVKMSKFRKKNKNHKSECRNIEEELKIIRTDPDETRDLSSPSAVQTQRPPLEQIQTFDFLVLVLLAASLEISLTFPRSLEVSAT